MKSPTKGHRRLTLADLGTVRCMVCDKDKTAEGARPFRAHHVCADCVRQVHQRAAARDGAPASPG